MKNDVREILSAIADGHEDLSRKLDLVCLALIWYDGQFPGAAVPLPEAMTIAYDRIGKTIHDPPERDHCPAYEEA
jgi:hypothetical protein